jgi:hypothetical protein
MSTCVAALCTAAVRTLKYTMSMLCSYNSFDNEVYAQVASRLFQVFFTRFCMYWSAHVYERNALSH